VLQVRSMTVTGMMDRFEKITSEKNGKFARINPVIFIAFTGYQFVAAWLRNNKFIDLLTEVAKQPAGHRTLFHRKDLFSLERSQDRTDSGYRSWH
jgi:hypothetical protein